MEQKKLELTNLKILTENSLNALKAGHNIKLEAGQLLKEWNRNYVVRFRLAGSSELLGICSVIVKQVKQIRAEWFAELAALRFLTETQLGQTISPRYLAHDLENGLIVMEDLGQSPLLENFLQGDNPLAAREALLQMARLLAQLHGSSVQRQTDYQKTLVQLQLPTNTLNNTLSRQYSAAYPGWVKQVEPWLEKLGLRLAEKLASEHLQITASLATPGALEVFTHGDIAPSQIIYTANGARLLDFEYAGYRHAFYDTLSWQIICPYPAAIIENLNQTYQTELQQFIPQATDMTKYKKDYLAYYSLDLFRSLAYLLPAVWEQDKPWAANFSGRQAIFYKLQMFSRYSRELQECEVLGELINNLQTILVQQWAAESTTKGPWQAFRAYSD